jgi:hypothetical protein
VGDATADPDVWGFCGDTAAREAVATEGAGRLRHNGMVRPRPPGTGLPRAGALLDLLEPGWRRDLSAGARAAAIEVEAGLLDAAARALGDQARGQSPVETARKWPACAIVTMARVAGASGHGGSDRNGNFWPGWHRAAGVRATRRSTEEWGQAFLAALALLGNAAATGQDTGAQDTSTARDAILAHAKPPPGPGLPPTAEAIERPRLDPFGLGVLLAGRPALPEEVVDPADPLLVFDENGERADPELPAERVWVLHPADESLRCDVPPRVIVTSRLPLTWRGWRLLQLDLHGVTWLELAGRDDHGRIPRRYPVRGRSKPGLRTGPPVPGVTAVTGGPVFANPPAVLLPPGPGRWRVEVRRARTDAVLSSLIAVGDNWYPELLWQRVPRPLLGELKVAVTAADGGGKPGLRRTLTVAEGLGASYFPTPRLTADRGLEPTEAALAAPAGMTVSPQAAPVPAEAVTVEVTCIAAQVLQRLRVTPPHIRIRIEPEPGTAVTPTRWHHARPLLLTTADLWHGGALSIDLPGIDHAPSIEVVSRAGKVTQVLDPTRQGRYPLRRMADTVTAHGGASLRITVGGRTATIARITAEDAAADPWAP